MSHFRTMYCLDGQLPEEVEDEVRRLWSDRELGNDYYYVHFSVIDEGEYSDKEDYPAIYKYIAEMAKKEDL